MMLMVIFTKRPLVNVFRINKNILCNLGFIPSSQNSAKYNELYCQDLFYIGALI